jgi:hypothetical protein
MTQQSTGLPATILKFVRGELPWTVLVSAGIDITLDEDGCKISDNQNLIIPVKINDIATGLLHHIDNPNALKEWAKIILSGLFIDLSHLENQTGGDVLMNALWDASMDGQVAENAISRAQELTDKDL